MPGYELDRLTYEIRAEDLEAVTRDYVVTNGNTFATNAWTVNMPKFVTTNDLDDFIEKLYKIIEDHTTINISKEEFMKILNE